MNTDALLTTITYCEATMATLEGIRSPFPAQPFPRSEKLRVYEYLHLLNQKLQETVEVLQYLEKCPGQRQAFLRSFQVELEDVRAQANFEVIEQMSEQEQHDWARFGRMRRQWDRQFEDPDDRQLGAVRQGQERRKGGLPSRAGVTPYRTVADQAKGIESTHRRKKAHSKKVQTFQRQNHKSG
jgi:hypothetical protein